MKLLRTSALVVAAGLLFGCQTAPEPRGVAASHPTRSNTDTERMARINEQGIKQGVDVIWVNPPQKKKEEDDNGGSNRH